MNGGGERELFTLWIDSGQEKIVIDGLESVRVKGDENGVPNPAFLEVDVEILISKDGFVIYKPLYSSTFLKESEGGKEGMGREGKGWEGKGREEKERKGKERKGTGLKSNVILNHGGIYVLPGKRSSTRRRRSLVKPDSWE